MPLHCHSLAPLIPLSKSLMSTWWGTHIKHRRALYEPSLSVSKAQKFVFLLLIENIKTNIKTGRQNLWSWKAAQVHLFLLDNLKHYTSSPGIIWMDLDKIATKGFVLLYTWYRKNWHRDRVNKNILNFPQRLGEWIFSVLFWTPQGNALAQKTFCCIFVSLGPRFGP